MKRQFFLNFIFSVFLVIFFSFGGAFATEKSRLIDNAKLLDSSEFESISLKLNEISEKQKIDIVILTENSLGGKSIEAYADDYFDYNDYGIGADKSGVLLLIDMGDRNSHISTKGHAINIFTDANLDYVLETISPELKSKNYGEAFEIFINLCDKLITNAKDSGKPGNFAKEPFNVYLWIAIAILVGLFASWITMLYMKKQLKTVTSKPKADDYIQKNSLQIKDSRDIFLYSSITRRARPKSNSGSSTHRSSSGSIHGGRSRRF